MISPLAASKTMARQTAFDPYFPEVRRDQTCKSQISPHRGRNSGGPARHGAPEKPALGFLGLVSAG